MKIERRPTEDDSQKPEDVKKAKTQPAKESLSGKEIKRTFTKDKLSNIFDKFKKES